MTKESSDHKQNRSMVLLIVCVLCLILILWSGSWLIMTQNSILKSWTDRGTFGDMFGAINSLFSGLAFGGVILTIILQTKELSLQREELEETREEIKGQKDQLILQNENLTIQAFENVFFQLLSFHNKILDSFDLSKEGELGAVKKGRLCFSPLYQSFVHIYNSQLTSYLISTKRIKSAILETKELRSIESSHVVFYEPPPESEYEKLTQKEKIDIVSSAYNKFQIEYESLVGHYFANLYNIFKQIDFCEAKIDKKSYTNLVRAQLSKYELLLLFYNCLSQYGNLKFKALIEKYQILKHVDISSLIHKSHSLYFEESAYSVIK